MLPLYKEKICTHSVFNGASHSTLHISLKRLRPSVTSLRVIKAAVIAMVDVGMSEQSVCPVVAQCEVLMVLLDTALDKIAAKNTNQLRPHSLTLLSLKLASDI